ncbi:MAG: LysR family transcriptional regulator [Eggerthellaceae bacterium]|nr:LysR family transcriptional regulator [Eggerthellaceae bacterium]
MRLEDLETFVAVAEALSYSKAAKQLYTAQSVITRRVAALEEELGVKLFERTTRSVSLTTEGHVFLKGATQALEAIRGARQEIDAARSRKNNSLVAGFVYRVMSYPASEWVNDFAAAYPQIAVRVVQENFAHLTFDIVHGSVDVGLYGVTDKSFIPDGLAYIVFTEGHEEIAVPRGHRLAGREFVTVEDLEGETFAFPFTEPTPEFSPAMREIKETGTPVHFMQTGFDVSAFDLVEKGVAITGMASSHEPIRQDVVVVPFRSKYAITGCLVWDPENPKTAVREFVEFFEGLTGCARGLRPKA